jgi:hypothetical protein
LDVSKSLERLAGLLNCKKNRLDRRRWQCLSPGKNRFTDLSSGVRRYFSQVAGVVIYIFLDVLSFFLSIWPIR